MGYVYLLSNPSMPGLVKIGCTDRSPSERISELSGSTAVPTAFVLEYAAFVENHENLERHLHRLFDSSRVNGSREFFNLPAQEVVREVRAQQAENIVQEIARWDESSQLSLLKAILASADIANWDEVAKLSLLRAILAKAPHLLDGPQLRPQHLDSAIAALLKWDDDSLMKLVDAVVQKRPKVRSVL